MNNLSVAQDLHEVSNDPSSSALTISSFFRPDPSCWTSVLDNETLSYIPSHWLQFPPPPRLQHAILAALYALLCIIGTFTNGTIIFLYCR